MCFAVFNRMRETNKMIFYSFATNNVAIPRQSLSDCLESRPAGGCLFICAGKKEGSGERRSQSVLDGILRSLLRRLKAAFLLFFAQLSNFVLRRYCRPHVWLKGVRLCAGMRAFVRVCARVGVCVCMLACESAWV